MTKNPRRAQLKGPKHCIFCDRIAGTRDPETDENISMSKQHLWPEWMHTPFPKTQNYHYHANTEWTSEGRQRTVTRENGDLKAKKLRIICERNCNNGWIRKLEELTSPYLLPLMRGERIDLSPEQQNGLALWICEMAIVWEYVAPERKCVPEAERKYVYEHRTPPPNWNIWMAQNASLVLDCGCSHHPYALGAQNGNFAGASRFSLQLTSFQIGQLFMHCSSSANAEMIRYDNGFDPNGLHRIWPATGHVVSWPSKFMLDDQMTAFLATRFHMFARPRD
jgi:hypothetical protein